MQAAWWGFLEGWLLLVTVVLLWHRRALTQFLRRLRSGFPLWQMTGGLVGASLIIGQAAAISTMGVALFTVLVVCGQTIMSLAVDRWGLAPGGRRAVTPLRTLGAMLMIAGVALALSGRSGATGLAPLLVLAVLGIGCLLPFQFAFNAQIAQVSGSALVAALVNFTVGTAMLTTVMVLRGETFAQPPSPLIHPAVWLAGFLGVFAVLIAARVVPSVGVLVFGLLIVTGQLVFSLLIDGLFAVVTLSAALVAGVLLCVVAVIAGSWPRRVRTAA